VALHELFFEQLAGKPRQSKSDSDFADAIHDDYVDFNGWKASIEALAKTRGVGWVLTLRDRSQDRCITAGSTCITCTCRRIAT
jgi:superoxide dismutase